MRRKKRMVRLMRSFIENFASNTWALTAEMAPYLLFGFAVAGLLHILIRKAWVQRMLGKPGIGSVVKACLVGVPMPLCSCSVIPVAASLRKSGASRGATAAFLSSTPQTGVDSILATYSLLGGALTLIRVGVAFISGIVSGFLIELFCNHEKKATPAAPQFSLSPPLSSSPIRPLSPSLIPPISHSPNSPGLVEALRYGFISLPADLGRALIIGLLLAGLITSLIPDDLIQGAFSSGILSFALATAISLPLYVCATASIPMAYALMAAGLSPGAALIFLITGPATNTATIATVWQMLGRRATLIYLGSLMAIAWLAGWGFNAVLSGSTAAENFHQHAAHPLGPWEHGSGVLLVLLLLYGLRKYLPQKNETQKSCCSE